MEVGSWKWEVETRMVEIPVSTGSAIAGKGRMKGLHNDKIILPRSQSLQPDRALLERRFQQFKDVG